jgi:DNA repair protein RecN (Recombination protein N)
MDPERLEAAHLRRSEVAGLLKRYASPGEPDLQIEELANLFSEVAEKIADLSGGEERLTALEMELEKLFKEVKLAAQGLSELRKASAVQLSSLVSTEIHSLSMPHTQFICSVTSPDYGENFREGDLAAHGCDEITMSLQTHSGGPIVPVAKGASGGELSRIMLALEVVLAQSAPVGTYIFDEVDAGVGGKAAIEVGRRLHALSRHAQVIVVTHLPQVAAWANSHFVLTKNEEGSVNQSSVTRVTGEARIEEVARMLAGHESSKSAREHAAELLEMAAE